MAEEINLSEHPLLEVADDIIREEKRRKRTKSCRCFSVHHYCFYHYFILRVCNWLLYANATSLSLLSKDPEARFAKLGLDLVNR